MSIDIDIDGAAIHALRGYEIRYYVTLIASMAIFRLGDGNFC